MTGTERGTGPAPPASPDYPAAEKHETPDDDRFAFFGFSDPYAGEERDIADLYRRRIVGLRRMPRRDRLHALRNARLARVLALKALREKRAWARYGQKLLRRLRAPEHR